MPKKNSYINPLDFMNFAFQQQNLAMATAETIWHRSSQLAAGTMTPSESVSMWMEKPAAIMKGFEKATLAAAAGKAPMQIMRAGMAPVADKASSNAKRLRG